MLLPDENRDSMTTRLVKRGLPALGIAVGVNVIILLTLAAMNEFDPPQREDSTGVQLVAIAPRVKQPEPPQPPEPDAPTPPEVVEVDLSLPADTSPPPTPLQIDLPLSIPAISAVNIAITPESPPIEQPAPTQAPVAKPAPSPATQSSATQSDEPRQLTQLPREISATPPQYPRSLQRRGVEGTVDMLLLIDRTGRVESVQYLSGNPAFHRAIDDVVYTWRFEPSTINGVPVRVRARKTMTFGLHR